MSETPDTVHGRLLEASHIAGYTFKRATDELEWLLDEDRWTAVGGGFTEIDAFLATLDLSEFKLEIEQRKKIARKLKELRATSVATAKALGVSHQTIGRDTAKSPDGQSDPEEQPIQADTQVALSPDGQSEWFQNPKLDPAKLVKGRSARTQREKAAGARNAAAEVNDDGSVEIRSGDFSTSLDDLAGFVSAIITDPPYGKDAHAFYGPLAELAARLLVPGGTLAVLCGTRPAAWLRLLPSMEEHLPLRWVGCYLTPGPAYRAHDARIATNWKPVLIFGGERSLNSDVFRSSGDDKRHHEWGQNEEAFASIVSALTDPGDLVVDPFLGGGTTAVVCRDLGRRFVGCDVDEGALMATRSRLAVA